MIGTIQDVLLAYVNGTDTVNDWRNKTNAIIHFLNTQKVESLPAIPFSENPPSNTRFRLWFNTKTMTLMTWFNEAWRQFHHVYTYEVKFYQKTISSSKVVPVGFNGVAVSPTIEDGVILEISEGSVLRII